MVRTDSARLRATRIMYVLQALPVLGPSLLKLYFRKGQPRVRQSASLSTRGCQPRQGDCTRRSCNCVARDSTNERACYARCCGCYARSNPCSKSDFYRIPHRVLCFLSVTLVGLSVLYLLFGTELILRLHAAPVP